MRILWVMNRAGLRATSLVVPAEMTLTPWVMNLVVLPAAAATMVMRQAVSHRILKAMKVVVLLVAVVALVISREGKTPINRPAVVEVIRQAAVVVETMPREALKRNRR